MIEFNQILPNDIAVEKAVLGGLLTDNKQHHVLLPIVLPEYFYNNELKEIFTAIKQRFAENKQIDIITISSVLPDKAVEITGLIRNIGSGAHLSEHIQILTDLYVKRFIIETLANALNNITQDELDEARKKLNELDKKICDIYAQFIRPSMIGEIAKHSLELVEGRFNDNEKGTKIGVPCPIADIKNILGGWQKSDLIILAARPSMGKTAFALHSAKFAAERGVKVLLFSIEMDAVRLVDRLITQIIEINPNDYRDGKIQDYHWEKITNSVYSLDKLNIYICDNPDISVDQIRSLSNKLKPEFIIIDYLQIIKMQDVKNFNMVQEIGKITRKLKIIARELNCPVMVLSQLNRSLESRSDKKPILSDLRESGNIEQDADVVVFLYRDAVYKPTPENEGKITAIIGKHRNGKANVEVEFKHNKYLNDFFDNETF